MRREYLKVSGMSLLVDFYFMFFDVLEKFLVDERNKKNLLAIRRRFFKYDSKSQAAKIVGLNQSPL